MQATIETTHNKQLVIANILNMLLQPSGEKSQVIIEHRPARGMVQIRSFRLDEIKKLVIENSTQRDRR